jgi:hypothetical protein
MKPLIRSHLALLAVLVSFQGAPPYVALVTPPPPGLLPLSQEEMATALPLRDINARDILVGPGAEVVYRLDGDEGIYIKVVHEVLKGSRPPGLASPLIGSVTYTQVCGVNVYAAGMLLAHLRNRASVTYYLGITTSPARFNWMDMSGTKTFSLLASWRDLGQRSSPSIGVRFNTSGYTQAWGNLYRSIGGVGRTDYYISYLDVKTSGTYCR